MMETHAKPGEHRGSAQSISPSPLSSTPLVQSSSPVAASPGVSVRDWHATGAPTAATRPTPIQTAKDSVDEGARIWRSLLSYTMARSPDEGRHPERREPPEGLASTLVARGQRAAAAPAGRRGDGSIG